MIDIPTTYLVSGLVFFIMPVITLGALYTERSRAVLWWCGGSLSLSVGLQIIGLRTTYYQALPFNTGFAFILAGNLLHAYALKMENQKVSSLWYWLLILLISVAIKEFFYQALPNHPLHFLVAYSSISYSLGLTGWYAYHLAAKESSHSARWIGMVNMVGCIIFFLRFILGALGGTSADSMSNDLLGVMSTTIPVFMGVINNIGIIGLYLERAQKRNTIAIAREAHALALADVTSQISAMDRQRSLGELSASLSHELGQPVQSILLNTEFLTQELRKSSPQKEELLNIANDIRDEASRASKILSGIRSFIQPQNSAMSDVSLRTSIEQVQIFLEPLLQRYGGQIFIHCTESNPKVLGDATQVTQVFLNLLRNSLEARDASVPPRIEIFIQRNQEFIETIIQDNGKGMSDQQLAVYGEPFSSTKEQGLGIGIAICRRIVQHYGGSISAATPENGIGLRTTLRFKASKC